MDKPNDHADAFLATLQSERAANLGGFEERTAAREAQQALLTSEQSADAERFARDDANLARRIAAIKFAMGHDSNDPLAAPGTPVNPWPEKPLSEPPLRGTWRLEPPRGGGAAKSRRPRKARSYESLTGLRLIVVESTINAGENGLTAYDLPELIEKRATGDVLERFRALKDQVKNAADGLYVAREAQHELGLVVERLGQRWRIRKALPHEVTLHG